MCVKTGIDRVTSVFFCPNMRYKEYDMFYVGFKMTGDRKGR